MLKATLIIPTIDNDGSDNSAVILQAIHHMIDINGGATVWSAQGYWKNDDGKLFADAVKVIESATSQNDDAAMREIAELVLDATDQEAVFYSFGPQAVILSK